jgi:hypothetical protein
VVVAFDEKERIRANILVSDDGENKRKNISRHDDSIPQQNSYFVDGMRRVPKLIQVF